MADCGHCKNCYFVGGFMECKKDLWSEFDEPCEEYDEYTSEIRECANCKHYVVTDSRTNWGSQETTYIKGCEHWECEFEPKEEK